MVASRERGVHWRAQKLSKEAGEAFDAWQAAGGETLTSLAHGSLQSTGLIADGLFGIGLERDLTGHHAQRRSTLRVDVERVLATEIDRASRRRADLECARLREDLRVHRSAREIEAVRGLLALLDAQARVRRDFDVSDRSDLDARVVEGWVIGSSVLAGILPRRPLNSHKGTFGNRHPGAAGMTGAALFGRAALSLALAACMWAFWIQSPSPMPGSPS